MKRVPMTVSAKYPERPTVAGAMVGRSGFRASICTQLLGSRKDIHILGQGIDLLRALVAAPEKGGGDSAGLPCTLLLTLTLAYAALWAIRAALSPSPARNRSAAHAPGETILLVSAVRLRLDALRWAVGTVLLLLAAATAADHFAHLPL